MLPDSACTAPKNPSDVPDSPAPPAPDPSVPHQVAALLSASRAAHLQKKQSVGRQSQGKVIAQPNYPKAEAHIAEALSAREAAEALDPEHTAPAWSEDLAANRGVTSAELIAFFRLYPEIP